MTGPGVERTPRTAFPSVSVPPTGVSASLPPQIQGAERRTENRARHTGTRWGLRVLVVGGLAGAAWLLTGNAAQAADRVDGPFGSLLGTVVGGTEPVTDLLTAADQPLEAERPASPQHHVVAGIADVPRRVLTRPVEALGEIVRGHGGTPVDTAIGGVDHVLWEVTGPARLTGGPADTHDELPKVTDAVTDEVADTVTDDVAEIPQPVADLLPEEPAATPEHGDDPADPVVAGSRTHTGKAFRAPAQAAHAAVPAVGNVPGKAGSKLSAHRKAVAHAARHIPAAVAADDSPGGGGPAAPLRLHLGDVSGTSPSTSGGSGTPTEGGSAAFLPAAITNSTMACQALPIVSDVEVRRHDAEAPTVSPD